MSVKKILLDNAYSAWQIAIKYSKAILEGRPTLLNRKNFVSSLQNAVELFIKQIMLDRNDYRVAEIRNGSFDGMPAREYYTSTDLNDYFKNISEEHLKKFYSIEFKKIIDIHRQVLSDHLEENQSFKHQLSLLSKLRNDETHFYITPEHFLSEDEFLELYNFMIDFYDIIEQFEMLPYWGESPSEYEHLECSHKKLTHFSYIEAIRNSKLVQKLAIAADQLVFCGFPGDTAYSITFAIVSCSDMDFSNQFDDARDYIEALDQCGLIRIECVEVEVENTHPEYGWDNTRTEQRFYIIIDI